MPVMEKIGYDLEEGEAVDGDISPACISVMPMMEKKLFDLEEGEADDHDVSNSYMDGKIQSWLDRFQKNLGGVSEELVAEKIYQYGSFLPVYWRGSTSLPAKEMAPISSNGDGSKKSLSLAPPSELIERSKSGCANASTSEEVQRKEPALKIRIKVGSEKFKMGLNKNMSLSKEDSRNGNIDQIMKEFEVMADPVLSPLPETLLCLEEREIRKQTADTEDLSLTRVNARDVNPRPLKSKEVFLEKADSDKVLKANSKTYIRVNASENPKEESKEIKGMLQNKGQASSSGEKRDKVCSKKKRRFPEKQIGFNSSEEGHRSLPCKREGIQVGLMNNPLENIANSPVNEQAVQGPGTAFQMIEENWVCCDKCQKWRLLPHGTNPDSLPKRWICAMMSWLPQMNKCSFSEDETTAALRSLYHLPPQNGTALESVQLIKPVKKKRKLLDNLDDEGADDGGHSAELRSVNFHATLEAECNLSNPCSFQGKPSKDHRLETISRKEKVRVKVKPKIVKCASPRNNDLWQRPKGDSNFTNSNSSKLSNRSAIHEVGESPVESVSSLHVAEKRPGNVKRKIAQGSPDLEIVGKEAAGKANRAVLIGDQSKIVKQVCCEADFPNFIRNSRNPEIILAYKQARNLKHAADRYKTEGLERKGVDLYFESALKFLHVASLLEPKIPVNGDHFPSISMYSDTAKLCGFCATEFERCKDMAAAALAYKCIEVAFMKVVLFRQTIAKKDQLDLQAFLSEILSDGSSLSPDSDIDDLNHQTNLGKAASAKGHSSSRMVTNHVDTPQIRLNLCRLLSYTQDINNAMDASKKCYAAFNYAKNHPEECQYGVEGIDSMKRILDLDFHAVDRLLHLIKALHG